MVLKNHVNDGFPEYVYQVFDIFRIAKRMLVLQLHPFKIVLQMLYIEQNSPTFVDDVFQQSLPYYKVHSL